MIIGLAPFSYGEKSGNAEPSVLAGFWTRGVAILACAVCLHIVVIMLAEIGIEAGGCFA